MPTGYTASLDDKNKTTKDWFTEDLVRAFGICVTLRGEPMGLGEKEIRARMKKDKDSDISYHQKALDKAKATQPKILKKKQSEWKVEAEKECEHRQKDNERRTKEATVKREHHEQVKKDLKAIMKDTEATEITRDIAKFGLKQLDTVKDECEPWLEDVTFTWKKYRADWEEAVEREVEYHTKELQEAKERWDERFEALNGVLADIKRIFG